MIRKNDLCHVAIMVVLVTAFSFVMLYNDYNRMVVDFKDDRYEVYEGSYNDFKMFESGLTIADNGAVHRNVYLGYINNLILDNEFLNLTEGETIESVDADKLENIKIETVFKMVLLHFHYLMAILVFLMFRLVDYLTVGVLGANRLFIRHKGDLSDDNFYNVLDDFKEIYKYYYNKMQIVIAIVFGVATTFIIRMAINLDDFRFVTLTLLLYALVSILNYILKVKVIKSESDIVQEYKPEYKDELKEDSERVEDNELKYEKQLEGKDKGKSKDTKD